MKARFEPPTGTRLLVEALREQKIVEHDEAFATAISAKVTLSDHAPGDIVIKQGDPDNDVLFILVGALRVLVNDAEVACRGEGECVGEMALLSPVARRSATLIARVPSVTARLAEQDFQDLAKQFPNVWRPVGRVVADRLREREKFHRIPNATSTLFIGSSVEGLPVADQLVQSLAPRPHVSPRPWITPGLFSPGGATLEILLREVDTSDFAAFVFGPDDKLASRGAEYDVVRDNVLFELGLFMGHLRRDRAFLVLERGSNVKIPTDLLGITPLVYVNKPGQSLATALVPTATQISEIIGRLGPR